jgi:hypothetical protein
MPVKNQKKNISSPHMFAVLAITLSLKDCNIKSLVEILESIKASFDFSKHDFKIAAICDDVELPDLIEELFIKS